MGEHPGVADGGDPLGGGALDGEACEGDVEGVVVVERGDEHAAVVLGVEQALLHEPLERLAHRAAGNAEALGELRLGELHPGLEGAVGDPGPDGVGDDRGGGAPVDRLEVGEGHARVLLGLVDCRQSYQGPVGSTG